MFWSSDKSSVLLRFRLGEIQAFLLVSVERLHLTLSSQIMNVVPVANLELTLRIITLRQATVDTDVVALGNVSLQSLLGLVLSAN